MVDENYLKIWSIVWDKEKHIVSIECPTGMSEYEGMTVLEELLIQYFED